eukprot:12466527-Prorocentrum_lima.AAC.1
MTSSLVGSEMCIRDSVRTASQEGLMKKIDDSSWDLVDQFIHGPLFFRKNLGSLVRKRNGSNRTNNFAV